MLRLDLELFLLR